MNYTTSGNRLWYINIIIQRWLLCWIWKEKLKQQALVPHSVSHEDIICSFEKSRDTSYHSVFRSIDNTRSMPSSYYNRLFWRQKVNFTFKNMVWWFCEEVFGGKNLPLASRVDFYYILYIMILYIIRIKWRHMWKCWLKLRSNKYFKSSRARVNFKYILMNGFSV